MEAGVHALGGQTRDLGEVTTPQLHFITWKTNVNGELANETYYFAQLVGSFRGVIGAASAASPLVVDAANGVAAPKLAQVAQLLQDRLTLRVINDGTTGGELNHKVRAAGHGAGGTGRGSEKGAHDAGGPSPHRREDAGRGAQRIPGGPRVGWAVWYVRCSSVGRTTSRSRRALRKVLY